MEENGAEVVALIRLAPLPFSSMTYVMGVTRVSIRDFLIGQMSFVFRSAPRIYLGCLMYNASLGQDQSFGDAQPTDDENHQCVSTEDMISAANIIFSILAGVSIGYLAKRKIQAKIKEQQDKDAMRLELEQEAPEVVLEKECV